MQILQPTPRPTESETPRVEPSSPFSQALQKILNTLKSENHCSSKTVAVRARSQTTMCLLGNQRTKFLSYFNTDIRSSK